MSIQNQSDRQNTPLTDEDINRAIAIAEENRKHFQQIILLSKMVLETEIEVFPGIRLVPFPPLGKRGKEIFHYVSKWASTVGIDYFFDKTQLIIDSSASSEFNGEQFCQALSLACNSGIQIATIVPVGKDEEPFNLVPYTGPIHPYSPRDIVKVSDIEETKRLYKLLHKLPLDVRRKLHIPINRWIKSHIKHGLVDKMIDWEVPPEDVASSPTTSDVDKMIDLGIAFESLYLSGSSNLSLDLRNRASEYLAGNQDEPEKLKEMFKEAYNWRSKAVHDGTLGAKDVEIGEESVTPLEFIKQVQDLCRRSILKILEDPHPRVILNLDKEYLKPLLKNGRKLRKHKDCLKCRLRLTNSDHCQLHAMIPPGGISERGYVKEAWIGYVTESIKINNQSYDLMTPEAHDAKQRIQEFMLNSGDLIKLLSNPDEIQEFTVDSDDLIKLLPNPDEIQIKYFQDQKA